MLIPLIYFRSLYYLGAEALGDMDWYILLNEERLFDPHVDLGTPDDLQLNFGNRDITFPSISPVQSFDGTHAARLIDNACLLVRKGGQVQNCMFTYWVDHFAVHYTSH